MAEEKKNVQGKQAPAAMDINEQMQNPSVTGLTGHITLRKFMKMLRRWKRTEPLSRQPAV